MSQGMGHECNLSGCFPSETGVGSELRSQINEEARQCLVDLVNQVT